MVRYLINRQRLSTTIFNQTRLSLDGALLHTVLIKGGGCKKLQMCVREELKNKTFVTTVTNYKIILWKISQEIILTLRLSRFFNYLVPLFSLFSQRSDLNWGSTGRDHDRPKTILVNILRHFYSLIIIRKTHTFLILVSPLIGIFSLTKNIEKYVQQHFPEV